MLRGTFALMLAASGAAVAQRPTPNPRPRPIPRIEIPAPAPMPEIVEEALHGLPEHLEIGDWRFEQAMEEARMTLEEFDFSALEMELAMAELHFVDPWLHLDALPDDFEIGDWRFELPGYHFDLDVDIPDMLIEMPDMHIGIPDMHIEMPDMQHLEMRDGILEVPPEPRFPDDPADSLYRVAREMLNRGEYRRAAETFRLISERHASSKYASDALYWEAFALYRIGTVNDTRAALAALERLGKRFPRAARESDATTLATRIRGELAANGDDKAKARLATEAQHGAQGCDRDQMAVRIEALNALSKLESEATIPALRQVLARKDECSSSLRQRAVFLLGRQVGPEVADLLTQVARTDPDNDVRLVAIGWLGRIPSDAALATLQEIIQKPADDRIASMTLRSLIEHQNPRGRQLVRQLIERQDVAESIRADAIANLGGDRATSEEADFLRSLYPRLESRRLKERVISTVGRIEGEENARWLAALARNENEPLSMRAAAVSRLASSAPIADVVRLYDAMSAAELRDQIIMRLGSRKEPEAVDKLLAIARRDSDPQLRRAAISRLSQKKDPRTTQLLLEIINQ